MVIRSTYFIHRDVHKETINESGRVVVDGRNGSSVMDVRRFRGACCDRDRQLVRINIDRKYQSTKKEEEEGTQ
jgi:hypothetical protein